MKAAVIYGVKDVRIEDYKLKAISRGEVKIEVSWTGICGSDLHAYHHGMAIPFDKEFPLSGKKAPLVLGHEFAGTVVEIGEGVTNLSIGDRVAVEPILYCGKCEPCKKGYYNLCASGSPGIGAFLGLAADGGFAEYVVTDSFRCHKLPDNVSLKEGALVEPAAVAHHAVKRSGLTVGQNVAIYGAGPIGLLTLLSVQAAGATKIFIIDISNERLEKAKELGATYVINPLEEDPVEKIMNETNGGVDVVFEAAGAQQTFTSAVNSLKQRGVLCIIAGYTQAVSLEINTLLMKEYTIVGSLAYANEFPEVIELIASGKLDVSKVVTKEIKLDNLIEDGLELLITDKTQSKILVSPK